ncbi:DUF423 domain-containing protein [Kordia sp.]|uniref:DUF423 domain-containing protein n=1 Tax=Kordia sp. TaxID=1965332 RepID=UPI0025BE990B|nr:DUF423 domain-containing protein [Kordia sp.]MCH2196957.1 DUF423 domain-containing protein [Kordia sp.]
MEKYVLLIATLYGALGIIFGAFGAHALKKIFSEELLKSFETGVKYQMYHAIVLLFIGFQLPFTQTIEKSAAWSLIAGTFLFSFSIYGLCMSSAKGKKLKFLGPITPLGGLLLVIGWILLGVSFL